MASVVLDSGTKMFNETEPEKRLVGKVLLDSC